ncbi:MAG: 2Fe-2S iron-sulfur cluster-binding protein, partial [Gammaproteobacteria bacterium]|nr:2Fe-2S iron-sulfur cluster-binding protein [Gammaproteobacteria bacterium]
MSQPSRLPTGGRVNRAKPLRFSFDGTSYEGYEGDTVASALMANDVTVIGRSFKYHRPRGIVAAGAEEPNAILQVGQGAFTVPNARATQTELHDGLVASSVNCWPNTNLDLLAITGLFSRLLPAGFYYKTFMWPPRLWMKYEEYIRKAAGLGKAPADPDPDHYHKCNVHCDLLVVGAGPTGLAAALAAGKAGMRVILADEQNELGGSLLVTRHQINGASATEWLESAMVELRSLAEVRLLARTTIFGYYDHNFLVGLERLTDHLGPAKVTGPRQRLWRIRAKRVVLATGAVERPLVFSNNDLPGIMLANAVSTYVNRYAVKPGSRGLIFTNNDAAYQTVLDLLRVGVDVTAVVDVRSDPRGSLPDEVRGQGIEVLTGSVVTNARGSKRIQVADIAKLKADGDGVASLAGSLGCDFLAVSGGWSPAVHLHAQSGGKPRFDEERACFVPGDSVQPEQSAGACSGTFTLGACFKEGLAAGVKAAELTGFVVKEKISAPNTVNHTEQPIMPMWLVASNKPVARTPKQFVDLQNDTSAADIQLAAREGYLSIEHVKRYTALGFGTDQGKLGNINGMAILAATLGQDIPSTGTTTFRPAYTPVTFGAIAGRDVGELFDPVRKTAMHLWHVEHDAKF